MASPSHQDNTASDPTEQVETPGSGEIQSGRLAGKSLTAAIAIVAFPVLLQQLMAAFVGLADKIFAGHLKEDVVISALDGVGVGSLRGLAHRNRHVRAWNRWSGHHRPLHGRAGDVGWVKRLLGQAISSERDLGCAVRFRQGGSWPTSWRA